MSKVSIAAKNVPFEAFLIVFLFRGVSRCHKEFVPHNGNGGHRVPLRNAPAGTAGTPLCSAPAGKRFHLPTWALVEGCFLKGLLNF